MLNRLLLRVSPWGLVLTGLAVGFTVSPVVRKGLRAMAVKTTRAALSMSDMVKNSGEKVSEGFSGIISEARAQQGTRNEAIKSKARAVGVAAVGGGLALVDRVKDATSEIKEKWDGLVTEARERKDETGVEATEKAVETVEETSKKED